MDPIDAAPVLPGETLAGKYRVERVLGKGGMGIVVAARHLELEERVAIKFLLGERAAPAVERFLREARAAAKVKSEHVCRVYDVARLETGEPYIVMEYLEGRDLGYLLHHDGPFGVASAAGWIIEACSALAEAHAAGIVHRDLKPANLFLATRSDGSTCIKVLDFGISKLPNLSDMTSTHVTMGSPLYMAPEQIASSRDVDSRADVWSLGIILHELVSGHPPFTADSMIALSVRIREHEPKALGELVPGTPPEFDAVIRKCLEKNPADRWGSVAALATALAPFASSETAHLAARLARRVSSLPPSVPAATSEAASAATPPEIAPTEQAPAKPGQVTFAPLHTTAERVSAPAPTGGRRWIVALVAGIVALVAISFALRPRGDETDGAASATASAGASVPLIAREAALDVPSVERADLAPAPAVSSAPVPTIAPVIDEAKDDRRVARPAATPVSSSSVAPAAKSAALPAPAPLVETNEPAKTPPEATTRKKRTLDRSDPF